MFNKLPRWMLALIGVFFVAVGNPVFAQDPIDPEISVAVPFDITPVIAAVLSIAVTVMIAMAGPKISVLAGKKILKMVGSIIR